MSSLPKIRIEKRQKFNLQPVLDAVQSARTLNKDGSITLRTVGAVDHWESYLVSAIIVPGRTQAFVKQVVNDALRSRQAFSERTFVSECRKAALRLEEKRRPMRAIFPVWGISNVLDGRTKQRGVSINYSFSERQNSRIIRERDNLFRENAGIKFTRMFPKRTCDVILVSCLTHSVNPADCFSVAEEALFSELGLITFLNMSAGSYRISLGERRPISPFLVCPMVTIHELDGRLATRTFWYNPYPLGSDPNRISDERGRKISASRLNLKKRLAGLPWRNKANDAFAKYHRAFSQTDLESSFLDAWRLLEFIFSEDRVPSVKYIHRAAALWKEDQLLFELGKHLKFRRDSISHGRAINVEDEEGLAFQMNMLIHPLMKIFVFNGLGFATEEEFIEFCDAPRSRDELLTRLSALKKVSKYRKY